MSNLAEIVLPPGTLRITVADVPTLFANAIHPDLPDDAPRFLTALAKQAASHDGRPEGDVEPLSGADRVAEEKLLASMDREAGIEMSYDTDWAVLEAIWTGLPTLTLPLRETEWHKYATAFEDSHLRPDWRLIATWKSPSLLNEYARIVTEMEHDKALDGAMAAGAIVPRSSLSLLPTPGLTGNQLNHAFFTVEELQRYAATHCIGVTVAPMPAVQEMLKLEGREKGRAATIDWNFWSAMPKAKHWQACALSLAIDPDSLKQSPHSWMAGPGHGPIFVPTSFPSLEIQGRFEMRLRLLDANRYDGEIFTLPMAKYSNLSADEVLLSEFAHWGEKLGWAEMPAELSSLAIRLPMGSLTPESKQERLVTDLSSSLRDKELWSKSELQSAMCGQFANDASRKDAHDAIMDGIATESLRVVQWRQFETSQFFDAPSSLPYFRPADCIAWVNRRRFPAFPFAAISTLESAPQVPTAPLNSQETGPVDEIEPWIIKAQELAQTIGLKKFKAGERQITARQICKPVALELEKGEPSEPQKYHGTQGPRVADAVRSVALKGWKFKYPSGINGTNGITDSDE